MIFGLARHGRGDFQLGVGADHVSGDRALLAEPPEPPHRLIKALVAEANPGEDRGVAVLPVEPEPGDARLGQEVADVAARERIQCVFLGVDRHPAVHLADFRAGPAHRIGFVVGIDPDADRIIAGVANEARHDLGAGLGGEALFLVDRGWPNDPECGTVGPVRPFPHRGRSSDRRSRYAGGYRGAAGRTRHR